MNWFIKLNSLTNFAAFFVGIALYRKLPKEIKPVFYFVALGAFTEIFARFFMHFVMKNAMPIGHFYFPLAILTATLFYVQILKGFINLKILWGIIIMFEVYCVINLIFIQSIFEYASLVGAIGSMIIFLFSVFYFIKVMVEAKIIKLSKEPLIWINTAFLIYYTFNFFYHSLYNLRSKASIEVALVAVKFFSSVNLLFYATLGFAFLMFGKTWKSR